MSYFLTNLIVETNSSSQNVTLEKNEQFQKHYQDIYDSLISIDDQLKELNKHVRSINNKLYFLSDTCLMEIYAYIYDEPLKALDLIKYCYEGLDDFIIKDKKIDSGDSPTKNSKIALEVIGFKNSFEESYIFDKILNLSEKQTSSLDFISYVMKYLDEQPHLIKKSFLGYFHNNLISNSFGWTIYCKTLLLSQEKFQNVFLFMEVCFYHNLTMALEMEAINKENILQTPAKKKYLLSDISDEENIRGHKLKFYYEKICNYLTDSKKCFEELKNDKNNKCEIINLIKYNQFIFQLIKYKDILELLINNNINESNNFDYLSLPKLSLSFEKEFLDKNLIKSQEVIENTINNIQKIYQKIPENHIFMETESDFLKLGVKNEFDLTITAMTYKVNYGYQPMLLCENWVYVPQSTNYMISLLACLSTASSSLISGGNKIGKKSILKVNNFLKKLNNYVYILIDFSFTIRTLILYFRMFSRN